MTLPLRKTAILVASSALLTGLVACGSTNDRMEETGASTSPTAMMEESPMMEETAMMEETKK